MYAICDVRGVGNQAYVAPYTSGAHEPPYMWHSLGSPRNYRLVGPIWGPMLVPMGPMLGPYMVPHGKVEIPLAVPFLQRVLYIYIYIYICWYIIVCVPLAGMDS
jgi:hypothetical protein